MGIIWELMAEGRGKRPRVVGIGEEKECLEVGREQTIKRLL